MRAQAPEGDCPKCGQDDAFVATMTANPPYIMTGGKPTYREQTVVRQRPGKDYADTYDNEWLAWPCRWCGYEMETPVIG